MSQIIFFDPLEQFSIEVFQSYFFTLFFLFQKWNFFLFFFFLPLIISSLLTKMVMFYFLVLLEIVRSRITCSAKKISEVYRTFCISYANTIARNMQSKVIECWSFFLFFSLPIDCGFKVLNIIRRVDNLENSIDILPLISIVLFMTSSFTLASIIIFGLVFIIRPSGWMKSIASHMGGLGFYHQIKFLAILVSVFLPNWCFIYSPVYGPWYLKVLWGGFWLTITFLSISLPMFNILVIGYISFILNLLIFALLLKNSARFKRFIIGDFFSNDTEFFESVLASTFGNPSRGAQAVATAAITAAVGREYVSDQIRREERRLLSRTDQIFMMTRKTNGSAQDDLWTMDASHALAIKQTYMPYTDATAQGTALIGKGVMRIFKGFN